MFFSPCGSHIHPCTCTPSCTHAHMPTHTHTHTHLYTSLSVLHKNLGRGIYRMVNMFCVYTIRKHLRKTSIKGMPKTITMCSENIHMCAQSHSDVIIILYSISIPLVFYLLCSSGQVMWGVHVETSEVNIIMSYHKMCYFPKSSELRTKVVHACIAIPCSNSHTLSGFISINCISSLVTI